jgi:hypothetical protein
LCLGRCSNSHTGSIPSSVEFSGVEIFPIWDNLYINNATSEGIYYAIYGSTPSRTVVFEYNTTFVDQKQQYCHFQVVFFEANPGIVQFIYLNVSVGGKFATARLSSKN